MADKLALALDNGYRLTSVKKDGNSYTGFGYYGYNITTYFSVYYSAVRKPNNPNIVLLSIDPSLRMASSCSNGAACYALPSTLYPDIQTIPAVNTYENGYWGFLRSNTATSMVKTNGWFYLFGSQADNQTVRQDGVYWTTLEVPVDPNTTSCTYDFFFNNSLGKGNGYQHIYNTNSYGARYNRMRFQFEVPLGYGNNGGIGNVTHEKGTSGGTLSWTQTIGQMNSVSYEVQVEHGGTWYKLGTNVTSTDSSHSFTYTYADITAILGADIKWNTYRLRIVGRNTYPANTTSYGYSETLSQWEPLVLSYMVSASEENGRTGFGSTLQLMPAGGKENATYQYEVVCSRTNEFVTPVFTSSTDTTYNYIIPTTDSNGNALVGYTPSVPFRLTISDGYDTVQEFIYLELGVSIENEITGIPTKFSQGSTVQLEAQKIDEKAINYAAFDSTVEVWAELNGESSLLTTAITPSTLQLGALLYSKYGNVMENQEVQVTVYSTSQVFSSSSSPYTFTITPFAIQTTLACAANQMFSNSQSTGPWFLTSTSTDPFVGEMFQTVLTTSDSSAYSFSFQQKKLGAGENEWTDVSLSKADSIQQVNGDGASLTLMNTNTCPASQTGSVITITWKTSIIAALLTGVEMRAKITPSYLSNPIIKKFTWSGLNSSSICALGIKTLSAKSWSPSSASFLDSNNAVVSDEIQSKTAINYNNTQGLITGNTTWGVYSIDWGTDENFKQTSMNEVLQIVQTLASDTKGREFELSMKNSYTLTSGTLTSVTSNFLIDSSAWASDLSIDLTYGLKKDFVLEFNYAPIVYTKDKTETILLEQCKTLTLPSFTFNTFSKPYDLTVSNIRRGEGDS